jgi:hypothetical protein
LTGRQLSTVSIWKGGMMPVPTVAIDPPNLLAITERRAKPGNLFSVSLAHQGLSSTT